MEDLTELHGYEQEALKSFINLCEDNNLRYYVIGGTLIGAVRHKGFIPWDDDVDVAMPREDYDKLLTIKDKLEKPYVIEDFIHNRDFKSYFAKVRSEDIEILEALTDNEADRRTGYLIDIIPIDGTPDGKLSRKLYYLHVLWLRFLCGTANVYTGIRTSRPKWEQAVLKVVRALRLYRLIDIHRVYKRMDRLFHKQDWHDAKLAGTITGAYKTNEIVDNTFWGYDKEPVYLDFEGLKVRAPYEYDKYLTFMFGNYMELPPEEKRKIHYCGEIIKLKKK